MGIYCLRISIAEWPCMDIRTWISMWISTLIWVIEDWHPKNHGYPCWYSWNFWISIYGYAMDSRSRDCQACLTPALRLHLHSRTDNIKELARGIWEEVWLTSTEDLAAAITTRGELGIVAVAAVDMISLRAELLVHKGHAALGAQEASFMPVLVLVRQILSRKKVSFVNMEQNSPYRFLEVGQQRWAVKVTDKFQGSSVLERRNFKGHNFLLEFVHDCGG